MDNVQDYYMQLDTGDRPLPVLVRGTTHEERVALARAQVSARYDVAVNMPLSNKAATAFGNVRTSSEEGVIVFSLTQFLETMTILVNEGRRLAWVCLEQGVRTADVEAHYERVPPLQRTDNLELVGEPIVIPGGETYFVMTKERALRFMAETIRDEAVYALQDAVRRVN